MAAVLGRRPPELTRHRSGTVSTDLDEATSNLLHASLDVHDERTESQRDGRKSEKSSRRLSNRRRKSLEDLRVPPKMIDSVLQSRDEIDRIGGIDETESNGESTAAESAIHAKNGHRPAPLLRRITSAEDVLAKDFDDGEDDEEDFTSDDEPYRCRPPSIASSNTSHRSSFFGIRIEDRTGHAIEAFAQDVHIGGYHSVGPQNAGGFVVFDVEIKTREGTPLRIHKRYSAFAQLRNQLVSQFPALRTTIPRLPPKSSFAKYRPSFLEKRRQHLSFWLSTVLLHPVTGSSSIVRRWVLE